MSRLIRACSCCIALLLAACASTPLERHEFEARAMGTLFRIVVFAPSSESAAAGATAAFERIEQLDAALSDYRQDSELSRVCAHSDLGAPTAWLAVSHDLFEVLAQSAVVAHASDGAFDVTAGPVIALWRRAKRQSEVPQDERIATALQSVGWKLVELDREQQRVRLLAPRMRIDLGGIAKGYAVDAALDVLAQHGLERALVVGGGDVGARRAPPHERGWHVELAPSGVSVTGDADPSAAILLENGAVSSSGDAEQSVELSGVRYSHIVDPRNGRALTERRAAIVIARDSTTADALATAMCVLGPELGIALAQRTPGVEARVVRETAHGFESAATPGFERLILPAPQRAAPALNSTP